MTRGTLHAVHPVLPVRDLQVALAFYIDRLGFRFLFGDRRGAPAYAGVGRDTIELHLQWQGAASYADGSVGPANLRFVVDEPERLLDELRAARAVGPALAVRETDWGTREFGLHDPDGNALTFYCLR